MLLWIANDIYSFYHRLIVITALIPAPNYSKKINPLVVSFSITKIFPFNKLNPTPNEIALVNYICFDAYLNEC